MLLWKRFANWLTGRADRDLERELHAHLDEEAEEQQASGLTQGDARYAARRAFGDTTSISEETRAMWGWSFWERLGQDFRYALRTMRKSPSFSAVAIVSLALGIGANTAIFTFVNAALLQPLPYSGADRIVSLNQRMPDGATMTPVHPRSFLEWRKRSRSFDALAIAQNIPINTQGIEGAEEVPGMWATASLFRVLAVDAQLGRVFNEQDEGLDRSAVRGGLSSAVAVISDGYWKRRFGSDPNVVGKSIATGNSSTTIIGVLPAGFRVGTASVDIYIPLPIDESRPEAVGSRAFQCYGLLRADVSVESAQVEMAVIAEQTGRDVELDKDWGVRVVGLRDALVENSRPVLLMLSGVVAFVLLIACANLAALLLTRGVGRQSELALRTSFGAGRLRLIQQLFVESVVISLAGGVLGLLFGLWASRALVFLATDAVSFGQMDEVGLDLRVLAFTMLLSLATAILFGLAPAWQTSRAGLQTALRQQGRGAGESRKQQRLRSALVVGEVTLAVVLLVGAGLLLRTFSRLLDVHLGFRPEQVLTMRTFVSGDTARRSGMVESILERVETLPDVRAAGAIQFLPLSGFTNNGPFHFIGKPVPADPLSMQSDVSTVSRGYFAAMGIPVLRGRAFERRDAIDNPRVALVNEAFVDRYCPQYCPDQDPVGQIIQGDWADPKPTEIIGIAGDVRHNGLTAEPRPTVFLSQAQTPGYITHLVVCTTADPQAMGAAIRREMAQVDPNQPITAIQPMEQYVARALAGPRLYAVLLGAFASLALVLAAIGLYGLMAYTVRQRTHEIGIRLALGAQPRAVLRSILGQGTGLALVGLTAGTLCAIALSRFLASLLYGVTTGDWLTYAGVALVLGGAAFIAAYLPARRASRVDPLTALRYE